MISPTSIISKSKAPENSEWDRRNLFAHFSELASVQNHPALAHVPPMTSFPQTRWFLLSNEPRKIWETDGLIGGIQLLTRNLDREWPEWAANNTNVLGILLSDLFADFFPWLEKLPVNRYSFTTAIRFERHLFAEAQLRHTWEWWRSNHKLTPNACFRPSLTGKKVKIVMAEHAVHSRTRRTYTWRGYYESESKKTKTEVRVTEQDWVLVE
ncbi:hypothetical protein CTheo_7964 [Ceratobasidium theobromae]|uniref:Uncharacterized protein n=1 Tax=Ceratobasidium theobromae TaxID=1582974 RepID=A0A5N5QB00_9AGAM|nr:hypothetical protein CTheo_7964 [Ceratobasidium theobromae]